MVSVCVVRGDFFAADAGRNWPVTELRTTFEVFFVITSPPSGS
jgi:hypothetical protein